MEKVSLVTDQDYLPALLKLLSSAKKSIDILSFSFAIGSVGGKLTTSGAPYKIADHIRKLKAKKPKLSIRFFVEGHRETADRNQITADFLEEAGVEVRYGATHAKGFCIDRKTVLFGSTNLSNQSIMKNREANLLISDKKAVSGFLDYFEHLWGGGHHGGVKLKPPMFADGDFKPMLLEMIARAKKRIDFSIYFFNEREIEKALIEASDRGVKVTGLIHEHKSFAMYYIRKNQATVKRMKASGVTNLFFGPTTLFSHSKYLVADSMEIALGTGNWLIEDVITHPQIYVSLKNKEIAKGLLKHLKSQIKV